MQIAVAQLEQHRTALAGHCYRMMGSVVDADDAVQETMVRAWKSLDRFDGRASLRTWLYRIATNVCLMMLEQKSARARPVEHGVPGSFDRELDLGQKPRTHWLEPVPDAHAIPSDEDPARAALMRESIRLAFVAALQHLPAKQRAVLLLSEVLGWSAAEIAECLESSVASVNSALQRARATLGTKNLDEQRAPLTDDQQKLLERYVDAFLRYDVNSLVSMLHHDATLSMPPYTLWLQGHESIRTWLSGPGIGCKGSKLFPVFASGCRRSGSTAGTRTAAAITRGRSSSSSSTGDRVSAMNSFLDTETLFPRFGLPASLPA